MVNFTKLLFRVNKELYWRKTFVDTVRVYVKGGNGGQGLPKYGGLGGDGGNIIAVATQQQSLAHIRAQELEQGRKRTRFIAKPGQNSHRRRLIGDDGQDVRIPVPVGISVIDPHAKTVIGELNEEGEEIVVAKGGKGGGPRSDYQGSSGETRSMVLDLKLIADVGLVGFPNAGKSTLLKAVSRANPKIANYPFTTIQPQLGTIVFEDDRRITMADLPGLIEGAYLNAGMGHSFLKHIERTKVLCMVVDVQGFQLSPDSQFRDLLDTILLLNKELELYNREIIDKPTILLLNKIDEDESAGAKCKEVKDIIKAELQKEKSSLPEILLPDRLLKFEEVLDISAKEGQNITQVLERVREIIDQLHDAELAIDLDKELALIGEKTRAHFPVFLT